MDAVTLAEAMGHSPGVDYTAFAGPFTQAMQAANITTVNRAAMWCAQIGHESAGLKYMEEIASGADYEGRGDLGNTQPGDGKRFMGSGPIQLTGRSNFRAFTRWANQAGHTDIDFEANPHLVRDDPRWGFLAASWYWTAARPQINALCDAGDIDGVTRAITGGLNGLGDRKSRWNTCLTMGSRLLPQASPPSPPGPPSPTVEKRLDYPRDQVTQDTIYHCGPASTQTIIRAATGQLVSESDLARELRTTTRGTDWIGQFPAVLNQHLPGSDYRIVEMPQDPPTPQQRDALWIHIRGSIDAGFGLVANIVAPPSNYPRASHTSTTSPAYTGGTVYHYIALMGYAIDAAGTHHVWVADSGFVPYGYWCTLDQLASLIPPKGYAYAVARTASTTSEGLFMSLSPERQEDLARKIDEIHFELTNRFRSRAQDPLTGEQSTFEDTLIGYVLEMDKKLDEVSTVRIPGIQKALDALSPLLNRKASGGAPNLSTARARSSARGAEPLPDDIAAPPALPSLSELLTLPIMWAVSSLVVKTMGTPDDDRGEDQDKDHDDDNDDD